MVVQFGLAMMPFGGLCGQFAVDLGDDERHVGIHAEGRRVVDHDRTGGGELGGELARRRCAGGEQRDVEAARVGGRGIFDDDVGAVPGQRRAGGTGRREVAHLGDREVAFGEQAPHHGADLACRADDPDTYTVSCAVHGEKTNGTAASGHA